MDLFLWVSSSELDYCQVLVALMYKKGKFRTTKITLQISWFLATRYDIIRSLGTKQSCEIFGISLFLLRYF